MPSIFHSTTAGDRRANASPTVAADGRQHRPQRPAHFQAKRSKRGQCRPGPGSGSSRRAAAGTWAAAAAAPDPGSGCHRQHAAAAGDLGRGQRRLGDQWQRPGQQVSAADLGGGHGRPPGPRPRSLPLPAPPGAVHRRAAGGRGDSRSAAVARPNSPASSQRPAPRLARPPRRPRRRPRTRRRSARGSGEQGATVRTGATVSGARHRLWRRERPRRAVRPRDAYPTPIWRCRSSRRERRPPPGPRRGWGQAQQSPRSP